MKLSSVAILLCFLISKGYTLTCYECDDCEKIDEKFLRECHISEHPPVTTESPESTDPTSPNLSSTTSSETSTSDGSDLPEGSTTEITPEISTEQTTTENNPSSQSTTEGSTTTSDGPAQTKSTTERSTTTSDLPTQTKSTTESLTTTSDLPTQTKSTTESLTTTSDLPTQGESTTKSSTKTSDLPTQADSTTKSSTKTSDLPTQSQEEKNSIEEEKQWNYARRVYRSIRRSEGSYGYSNACYSLQWKDNDKTKVKRGCTEVPSELAACDIVKNQIHDYVENSCTACVTDKCNGSGAIQVSIILLLVTLIVSQFAK